MSHTHLQPREHIYTITAVSPKISVTISVSEQMCRDVIKTGNVSPADTEQGVHILTRTKIMTTRLQNVDQTQTVTYISRLRSKEELHVPKPTYIGLLYE